MKNQESKQNEERLRNLQDNFKHSNIRIIGVPEGEGEDQDWKLTWKIMKENFPSLAKEVDIQVQEALRVLNKLVSKRATPRHIIIKMPKVKEKES